MGTSGLLKTVKPFVKFVSFSHWRGMRVGMDASMSIHQLLGRFALEIMRDDWTGFADADTAVFSSLCLTATVCQASLRMRTAPCAVSAA